MIKPVIHPNYIFKEAGVKTRVFPVMYTEPIMRFDSVCNKDYVGNLMKSLPFKVICEIEHSDLGIRSGTNTGKTTYVASLIKKKYMNDQVFVISNRVSLSHQFIQSFKESKFKHYQDPCFKVNGSIENYIQRHANAKLIIQINSLLKMETIPKDHILILDEVSSLLQYLISGNIKHTEDVYYKFIELIKNAKRVICMDGDLDQYSVDFINSLRPKPLYLINNEYQNAKGIKCLITRNLDEVKAKIKESLDKGKYTAHCCDTKAMVKHINDTLVELGVDVKKIKSYHTDSKEDRNDLKDVNTHWANHHVSFSPSIVTGVDYTADSRTVFLYVNCSGLTRGKGVTINARAMAQQIARVRKIDELVVYLETNSYDPGYNQ